MYFWKIEELKKDIKSGQLNEKDRFIYACIYITLSAIAAELMMLMPLENGNVWDLINSSGNVLIVLIGTILAFRANGGPNGNDFLGRYFSIGFVIAIRFLVYLIPLFILLFFYYSYAYEQFEEVPTSFIDTVPFLVWYAAMYWRIYVHIKQVCS